jgi:hypothetical protein
VLAPLEPARRETVHAPASASHLRAWEAWANVAARRGLGAGRGSDSAGGPPRLAGRHRGDYGQGRLGGMRQLGAESVIRLG